MAKAGVQRRSLGEKTDGDKRRRRWPVGKVQASKYVLRKRGLGQSFRGDEAAVFHELFQESTRNTLLAKGTNLDTSHEVLDNILALLVIQCWQEHFALRGRRDTSNKERQFRGERTHLKTRGAS
jgi:hypothetical protein